MDNTYILFWNCQGISQKRLELLQLIKEKKIDILLPNETYLSTKTKIKMPNYHTYTSNRSLTPGERSGGGTTILVHRKFIHHKVYIKTSSVETTTIQFQMGNEEIRLTAIYKKPSATLNTADIDKILDSPLNTIIAGDLNAKHTTWNSRRTNTAGNKFERYLNTRTDITVAAPDSPTHYPDNPKHNPDVLDIAIMKTGSLQYQLDNLTNELTSDHTPVILNIQARCKELSPPRPLRTVNWPQFEEELKNNIQMNSNIKNTEQIDSAIEQLIH